MVCDLPYGPQTRLVRGIYSFFGQQFPFAPMPPPPAPVNSNDVSHDSDALASMLMAWYLSGYHTGYYQVSDHSVYYPAQCVQ